MDRDRLYGFGLRLYVFACMAMVAEMFLAEMVTHRPPLLIWLWMAVEGEGIPDDGRRLIAYIGVAAVTVFFLPGLLVVALAVTALIIGAWIVGLVVLLLGWIGQLGTIGTIVVVVGGGITLAIIVKKNWEAILTAVAFGSFIVRWLFGATGPQAAAPHALAAVENATRAPSAPPVPRAPSVKATFGDLLRLTQEGIGADMRARFTRKYTYWIQAENDRLRALRDNQDATYELDTVRRTHDFKEVDFKVQSFDQEARLAEAEKRSIEAKRDLAGLKGFSQWHTAEFKQATKNLAENTKLAAQLKAAPVDELIYLEEFKIEQKLKVMTLEHEGRISRERVQQMLADIDRLYANGSRVEGSDSPFSK